MYDDRLPYTCLIEDKDLKADSRYYRSYWLEREKAIRVIQKEIGYESDKYLTCHGFQTISAEVMNDFKHNFMSKKNYSYLDLVLIAPLEFSWYNMWIQKQNSIPIHVCEPHFKYFHMRHQVVFSWWRGIRIEDLARSYVGIVLQSNYGKKLKQYEKIGRMHVEVDTDIWLCIMKSIGYTVGKKFKALIRR